jgi:predicted RNA-binding protein YlxR (DUF448 family)/ribosomal protein L7Ae-like RNA K-turn-binding protein
MARTEPQRSCLGCREVKEKKALLRFVLAPDGTLVPDLAGKLPGRGAYTCFRKSCLMSALAKKGFARSFKGAVLSGEPGALVDFVAAGMVERIAGYLSLANKAGKVVSGGENVLDALRNGSPGVIFIATDISPDIGQKLSGLAERSGADIYSLFDKDRLGALLGKEMRSAVVVEQGGFSRALGNEMEKYRIFIEGGTDAT